MREYDLIVVGTGAGLSVLSEGLQHGLECALIESGKFGGTCLTRGCIPSKVLTYVADMIRSAEHSKKIGLSFDLQRIDWKMIAGRMRSQIDESKDIESQLSGIPSLTIYKGTGEFTGKHTMRVALSDGSFTKEFKAKQIVLASGGRSFIPPVKGLDETGFLTTETFFGNKFPEKPWESLILIGGGIIAAEFAHIFSALGTKITIVEMGDRLLPAEEPVISEFVKKNFEKRMNIFIGYKAIEAYSKDQKKYVIIQESGTDKKIELKTEEVFICSGRRSNSDLLKVDKCGIETYGHGNWIKTNEYLETNVPGIRAIGDANGLFQFRHKANSEAEACIKNMFGSPEEKTAMDYSAVPWAVFTYPQIGHVGMTEKEALDKGHFIYRAIKHYSSIAKGFAMGYEEGDMDDGFVKLIIDSSLRILGAHVAGPHAEMLIQPFVYLMNSGFTCDINDLDEGASKKKNGKQKNDTKVRHKSDFACPGAGSVLPMLGSMVIHPSLNEVSGWILGSLESVNIPHEPHHSHK